MVRAVFDNQLRFLSLSSSRVSTPAMATKAPPIVRASDGRIGAIVGGSFDRSVDPQGQVDVLLDDGERILVPMTALIEQADGSYRLELSRPDANPETELVVPVIAESAEVGKRKVETGKVRVRKTVRATEKVVDEPLLQEDVEVVRVPINREIPEAVGPRQEGETLIVPLLEEVLVVEKRLILREEVRITRRKTVKHDPQTVVLRSEEATVERSGVDPSRPET